jgi:hypothetical protein
MSEMPRFAFKEFNSLDVLRLRGNGMKSFNAQELGISDNCKEIDLSNNSLTSMNFTDIGNLALNFNNLTSFIPHEIGLAYWS